MRRKWVIIIAVIFIFFTGILFVGPIMSNVEQPNYKIRSSVGKTEIRVYEPMILAEVLVQGLRTEAGKKGFRILADYIFGNNVVQRDIAMTAPVQQQGNKKISMTAPVKQEQENNAWKISFVMPSEYSITTIPQPNNKKILLHRIPQKTYIVMRFSGANTNENIEKYEKELLDYTTDQKINIIGSPKYAFYNPPWTLPFMRRNEIIIEIHEEA